MVHCHVGDASAGQACASSGLQNVLLSGIRMQCWLCCCAPAPSKHAMQFASFIVCGPTVTFPMGCACLQVAHTVVVGSQNISCSMPM